MPRANEQVLEIMEPSDGTTVSTTYKYRKRGNHDVLAYTVVQGTLPSDGTGGGAITGTIVLEATYPDGQDWVAVANGTFTDSEASGTFVPGGDMDIRWSSADIGTTVVVRIG